MESKLKRSNAENIIVDNNNVFINNPLSVYYEKFYFRSVSSFYYRLFHVYHGGSR